MKLWEKPEKWLNLWILEMTTNKKMAQWSLLLGA